MWKWWQFEIVDIGNRSYLINNRSDTPFRRRLKKIGARWDPSRRSWYVPVSDKSKLEEFVQSVLEEPIEHPSRDDYLYAEATHRGKKVYIAGDTYLWPGGSKIGPATMSGPDGPKIGPFVRKGMWGDMVLVFSADGSKEWWAYADELHDIRVFNPPRGWADMKRMGKCYICGRTFCNSNL